MSTDDDYQCIKLLWIDTEGYSERDREMFACGVEFEVVTTMLEQGWKGTRSIHRENESRIRMAAARFRGIKLTIEQHNDYSGCETWSQLTVIENARDEDQ